jgi:3D (Asp-Asp-Asp) domain-containing protein
LVFAKHFKRAVTYQILQIWDAVFECCEVVLKRRVLMKNLVRGGALLLVLSMLAVIVYAQAKPNDALNIANDSQTKTEKQIINIQANIQSDIQIGKSELKDSTDDRKLVKTTAMVSATGRGASRGSFSATAYCLSGKTALGHKVRRGIIAADPRVLRLGSTVTIGDGGYAGKYVVSDTGSRIKGKKIDIWVPNCSEARKFGRRNVQIFQ